MSVLCPCPAARCDTRARLRTGMPPRSYQAEWARPLRPAPASPSPDIGQRRDPVPRRVSAATSSFAAERFGDDPDVSMFRSPCSAAGFPGGRTRRDHPAGQPFHPDPRPPPPVETPHRPWSDETGWFRPESLGTPAGLEPAVGAAFAPAAAPPRRPRRSGSRQRYWAGG